MSIMITPVVGMIIVLKISLGKLIAVPGDEVSLVLYACGYKV